jgi:tetratricopeptide (TPR) repeat protein
MGSPANRVLTCEKPSPVGGLRESARLDKLLDHARKITTATLKPDFQYATELLTECILSSPGNIEYVTAFLENLHKQYNNNLSGAFMSRLKEHAARSAIKKALADEAWDEVVKQGVRVLKVNPWDAPALMAMAAAAKQMGHGDTEMYYLKNALLADAKNPAVNRQCAIALGERMLYDQAIACWHRIEEALPNDEEPKRAIAFLQSMKMRGSAAYDAETIAENLHTVHIARAQPSKELTVEEQLVNDIEARPAQIAAYLELSEYYIGKELFDRAEQVLAKALEMSGGDPDVEEKLDDAKLRRFRHAIIQTNDPARKQTLQDEYYRRELEFFKKRCDRYPNNRIFRYDLGCRYMLVKKYPEAIRQLQQSRNNPRRKGLSILMIGKCFQHMEQYELALSHYKSAAEEISERDPANKNEALRLAGKLALALGKLETAEKYLSALAAKNFTYKDVAHLLGKLARARQNHLSEH